MAKNKNQSYRYIVADSILHNQNDEYSLSPEEYYRLYNFFCYLLVLWKTKYEETQLCRLWLEFFFKNHR